MADKQSGEVRGVSTPAAEQTSGEWGQLVIGSSPINPYVVIGSTVVGRPEEAAMAPQTVSASGELVSGGVSEGDRKKREEGGVQNEGGVRSEGGVQREEGGVRSEDGGIRSEEGRVRSEEGRVQSEDGGVRSEEGRVRSEEGRVRSEEGGVRSEEGLKGQGEGEKKGGKGAKAAEKGDKHTTDKTSTEAAQRKSGPAPPPSEGEPLECPICRSSPVHPVQTPCGHVFCFLCIKGVLARDSRCCMCRKEVPPDFLEHPSLLATPHLATAGGGAGEGKYHWYYAARGTGWWMFEERISSDIEDAYQRKLETTCVYISGFQYIVDLTRMVQYREAHPSRTRRIKREKTEGVKDVRGVAGIKTAASSS